MQHEERRPAEQLEDEVREKQGARGGVVGYIPEPVNSGGAPASGRAVFW